MWNELPWYPPPPRLPNYSPPLNRPPSTIRLLAPGQNGRLDLEFFWANFSLEPPTPYALPPIIGIVGRFWAGAWLQWMRGVTEPAPTPSGLKTSPPLSITPPLINHSLQFFDKTEPKNGVMLGKFQGCVLPSSLHNNFLYLRRSINSGGKKYQISSQKKSSKFVWFLKNSATFIGKIPLKSLDSQNFRNKQCQLCCTIRAIFTSWTARLAKYWQWAAADSHNTIRKHHKGEQGRMT